MSREEAERCKKNLRGANLCGANLSKANLRGADLRGANLCWTDLSRANLRGANLRGASLCGADLCGADLRGADLRGADLDFSQWPLWCGSENVKIDERLARQLLAHAFNVSKEFWPTKLFKKQVGWLNEFHQIKSGNFPKFEE